MKKIFMGVILTFCPFFVRAQVDHRIKNSDKAPWVYFDLGDTVVSTQDLKHIHYFKGAREYMEDLKRNGFKIGIITNIPETWGMDYEEKLTTLKKFIADGWDEKNPFDWSIYDDIILPLKDSERKPEPTLYIKAINEAEGCPAAFIGDSDKEVKAASSNGMAAKLFMANDAELYIPVNRMNRFLRDNYKRKWDPDCIKEFSP